MEQGLPPYVDDPLLTRTLQVFLIGSLASICPAFIRAGMTLAKMVFRDEGSQQVCGLY